MIATKAHDDTYTLSFERANVEDQIFELYEDDACQEMLMKSDTVALEVLGRMKVLFSSIVSDCCEMAEYRHPVRLAATFYDYANEKARVVEFDFTPYGVKDVYNYSYYHDSTVMALAHHAYVNSYDASSGDYILVDIIMAD